MPASFTQKRKLKTHGHAQGEALIFAEQRKACAGGNADIRRIMRGHARGEALIFAKQRKIWRAEMLTFAKKGEPI